jgi:hypothetical protein
LGLQIVVAIELDHFCPDLLELVVVRVIEDPCVSKQDPNAVEAQGVAKYIGRIFAFSSQRIEQLIPEHIPLFLIVLNEVFLWRPQSYVFLAGADGVDQCALLAFFQQFECLADPACAIEEEDLAPERAVLRVDDVLLAL